MTAAAVQRAIVRMLFDPAFRDAVYAAPDVALAGTDLDADERAALVRPDRRAYATDGERQMRTLRALAEELPAATAWAAGQRGALTEFFASREFHACIEARGVLTLAYAAWLGRAAGPALATLVALEGAVAAGRRDRCGPRAAPGTVALSPRAALVATDDHALAWWDAVRAAAAADAPLPEMPSGDPCVALLVVAADGTSAAEVLADGLAGLLAAARPPQPRAALEAHAATLGLAAADARALLDELLADGVLAEG